MQDDLTAFLRGQAEEFDREAYAIDLMVDRLKPDSVAGHFCAGASFALRNVARAFREQIPTEAHEFDCTPFDLIEGVAA